MGGGVLDFSRVIVVETSKNESRDGNGTKDLDTIAAPLQLLQVGKVNDE